MAFYWAPTRISIPKATAASTLRATDAVDEEFAGPVVSPAGEELVPVGAGTSHVKAFVFVVDEDCVAWLLSAVAAD